MKILDSLKNTQKIKYSVDIEKNQIPHDKLEELLRRMLRNDFGKVGGTLANDFKRRIEKEDKDVYGIYDDIVVYYDAELDEITFLTKDEFQNFYQADWTEEDRIGFNVRYGGARQNITKPGKFVKEGQTREILGSLEEVMGKEAPGLATTARLDYKIYPHTDYQGMIKELGPERMENIKTLAKEKGIYPKRLIQLIAYQHYVQHKTTEDSYQYAIRALAKGAAALSAKDTEPDFTKQTSFGAKILEVWESDTGRKFVIVKRKSDYAFGAGYDKEDGTWAAGYYDYSDPIEARQAMYRNYPYNEFKRSSL